ncbi:MAG: hypothetical protein H7338_08975 [Candidatus Sericytochromatia bacterium]|nr:hypothetical protein [Candidatus Sericytochromatia bacterium]
MAVNASQMQLILSLITRVRAGTRPVSMVFLGYPDIILNPEQLAGILGPDVARAARPHPDSVAILRAHSCPTDQGLIVWDADHLFGLIGTRLTSFDWQETRRTETIHDLNQPLPEALHGSFDLVFDNSTVHCCFNVSQALINAASLVRVGGMVFHTSPLNQLNVGYYALTPTLIGDFYEQNGFVLHMLHMGGGPSGSVQLPRYDMFHAPPNAYMGVVARRVASQPLGIPKMQKYLGSVPRPS